MYTAFGYLEAFLKPELATLFETCRFTAETTQVVDPSTAYHTTTNDFNLVDRRGDIWENPLYTHIVGDLANSKSCRSTYTATLNAYALVLLDTLFVAFFDANVHVNRIASFEVGQIVFPVFRFDQFDQIVHLISCF